MVIFLLDVCKSNYQAYESEEVIRSPGYPDNIGANSSCEYYIDIGSFSPDDVIQIRFRELSFGPNDTLTVYDAMTNAIIFGPLVGPQRIIRANTTKSISVKIVLLTKFVPSIKQRYIFLYRGVPRGMWITVITFSLLFSLFPVLFYHLLSSPTLSQPLLSFLILLSLIFYHPLLYFRILSYLFLTSLIFSCPLLSFLNLCCLLLFSIILPSFSISYLLYNSVFSYF